VKAKSSTTLASIGLIARFGAIGKKISAWHAAFWGGNSYGQHYDLMFAPMNPVIVFTNVFTNGGAYVLLK
jgi:hypothetical protein